MDVLKAKGEKAIELSSRQLEIIELVKQNAPITGEQIAEMLGFSRPTIRSDLSLLVMLGYLDAKPKVGYFLGKSGISDFSLASKLSSLKVKDVQALPVIVLESTSVHEAVVTLFTENVGSLVVTDTDGELIGVVSRKDLLKVTVGSLNASTTPMSLVMTRQPNIITVSPEDSVLEAGKKMLRFQIDNLPVVVQGEANKKIEVVGRISKTTLVKILVGLAVDPDNYS